MNNTHQRNTQYTVDVKRTSLWSFMVTIIVAAMLGFFAIRHQQRSDLIQQLLESPAVTDQLQAIDMLRDGSFDKLQMQLDAIMRRSSEASIAAQELLVQRAFREQNVGKLSELPIDASLLEAALWWDGHDHPEPEDEQQYNNIVTNASASPWIRRLAALHCKNISQSILDDFINMPPRDRDGSVVLTVLAVEQHVPKKDLINIMQTWATSLDTDQQKVAVLLAALTRQTIPIIPTQDSTLAAITSICVDEHVALAWRTMHNPDGTINPDIALAAMIIDQERFFPILIKTARLNQWTHPDHPIEIARHFIPSVANLIPISMVNDANARSQWWARFACGLLREER